MSVLSRSVLEASPLADLHAIASEVGIDGFRRLRKEDLVEAILDRQGGDDSPASNGSESPPAKARSRSRSRSSSSGDDDGEPRRSRSRASSSADADSDKPAPRRRRASERDEDEPAPRRRRSSERSTSSSRDADDRPAPRRRRSSEAGEDRSSSRRAREDDQTVEGVIELLENGSGFIRVNAPETSDDDVYVSAAQIRRCELVPGDRVGGPARRARRSERHPSLVRVETINGVSADEVSDGTRYADLAAGFAAVPIAIKAKDATLKQVSDLAPIGRGSRVTVCGGPGSGRTTTLRLLAIELAAEDEIEVQVVLAGARPEELAEWTAADLTPAAVAELGQSPDAQAQVIDRVIDAAKRVAARGGHAAVVIDAFDQLPATAARRALGAARCVPGGGTLTVIAAAREPVAGETTLIRLDAAASAAERRPVLDASSYTLRVEALVGARKATTIAKNRAKLLGEDA